VSERGEKQIAEIMASEAAAGAEAILKQSAEQCFVFGEGHHAVANITGRKNAIFAAQASGAATVIGDGDNGGKIDNGTARCGIRIMTRHDMLLQTAQQRGKAGTTAESHHSDPVH